MFLLFLSSLVDFLYSLLGLLVISFLLSIPAWLLALAGARLHARIQYRFGFSWIQASLVSTYIMTALLILLLYFIPVLFGLAKQDLGLIPPYFQLAPGEGVVFLLASFLRVALVGLVLTLLLAPFLVVGDAVFEHARARLKKSPLPRFLAVFAATLLAVFIALFVFPGTPMGLIYLIFFSGA